MTVQLCKACLAFKKQDLYTVVWPAGSESIIRYEISDEIEAMTVRKSRKSTRIESAVAVIVNPARPTLLAGGNPQIAKADGDAPVQAYIEAMPDWKCDLGRHLDALIVSSIPHVQKAVRWNTPFYGIKGQGWFLAFNCTTKYLKVAFFHGTSLRPVPPVESRQKKVRYFHMHENDILDEQLLVSWIRQASELPGEHLF